MRLEDITYHAPAESLGEIALVALIRHFIVGDIAAGPRRCQPRTPAK